MTQTLTQRLQRAVALRDAAMDEPVGYALSNPDGSPNLNAVYQRLENAEYYSQPQHAHGGFGPVVALYIRPDAAPSIVQLAVELGAECERMRKALSEQARLALAIRGACFLSQRAPNVFDAIGDWSRDIIKAAEDAINPPDTDCGDAQ